MKTIDRLIEHFDNQSKTAKAIAHYEGKTQPDYTRVNNWVKRGFIPFHAGRMVETITLGAIKASEVWEDASKDRHHFTNREENDK